MALTKLVNGKRVTMTQQEEDAVRAEWEADDIAKQEYLDTVAYRDYREREYTKRLPLFSQVDALRKQLDFMRTESAKLDPTTTTHEELVTHVKSITSMMSELDAVLDEANTIKAEYPKPA